MPVWSSLLNRGKVERARGVVEPQDANQHQDRAGHRVENEFYGGVNAALVAPDADQQVHRNQHYFPEEEEEEQIEREEDADDADFEKQEGDEKFFDALLDAVPGAEDGDDGEKRRQDDEEQADAVHAEVIVDVTSPAADPCATERDPLMKFLEFVARAAERHAAEEPPERQNKFGQQKRRTRGGESIHGRRCAERAARARQTQAGKSESRAAVRQASAHHPGNQPELRARRR